MKKGIFNGNKYVVYNGGMVSLRNDNSEVGYLDEAHLIYLEENKYSGINLDNFVEHNIHVPLFVKNKSMENVQGDVSKSLKYPKTLQASILLSALGKLKFENILAKYIEVKNVGNGAGDKNFEMYNDYKIGKMSFEQISKKYNVKTLSKVKKIITDLALMDARGELPKRKSRILSVNDFHNYGHFIEDEAIRKIVERSTVNGELMADIAVSMNITKEYGYVLKSKGVNIIFKHKNNI